MKSIEFNMYQTWCNDSLNISMSAGYHLKLTKQACPVCMCCKVYCCISTISCYTCDSTNVSMCHRSPLITRLCDRGLYPYSVAYSYSTTRLRICTGESRQIQILIRYVFQMKVLIQRVVSDQLWIEKPSDLPSTPSEQKLFILQHLRTTKSQSYHLDANWTKICSGM